jgi:hypothetical protein
VKGGVTNDTMGKFGDTHATVSTAGNADQGFFLQFGLPENIQTHIHLEPLNQGRVGTGQDFDAAIRTRDEAHGAILTNKTVLILSRDVCFKPSPRDGEQK